MWVLISFLRRESPSVLIHSPPLYLLFLSLLDIGNYQITCLLGFYAYGTLQSREEIQPLTHRRQDITQLLHFAPPEDLSKQQWLRWQREHTKTFDQRFLWLLLSWNYTLWKITYASHCLKLCILGAKIKMHSIDKNRKSKRNIQWNPLVFRNTLRIFYQHRNEWNHSFLKLKGRCK